MSLNTYHIHLEGLVQGVGFRPYVYTLAGDLGLHGWVNNTAHGVDLEFNSDENTAREFRDYLIHHSPPLSKITKHSLVKIAPKQFSSFDIIESRCDTTARLIMTPDYAMCSKCKSELYDAANRRYKYAFVTCTQCGPRYSIIENLPYDRDKTTMHKFEMCSQCSDEYYNPQNRRHYSQTNSCGACGIAMEMFDEAGKKYFHESDTLVDQINKKLVAGKIVAVKGIGGYLLLTDANNKKSVTTLRERKHRPTKPFAIMFPGPGSIKQIADLSRIEESFLQDVIAPIVLLTCKEGANRYLCTNEIAPRLSKIGVMLPYTPLFELILEKFGKPLIATSANISDAPIIYQDEIALRSLTSVADFIITNNREIMTPQDDSVIKFTRLSKQKIIIRRSRGLAPSYFNYECSRDETILATGALLKSSFTYVCNGLTYVSQYLGNTESYEAQEAYIKTVQHFLTMFNKKPGLILTDKHPEYFSNFYGKKLAAELKIEVRGIQHHKAHFAAVLAENELLHSSKSRKLNLNNDPPVLGVIWDGTGLGDDGNIWGGEFFLYETNAIRRHMHFDYFPFILGDKMVREPRISALSACTGAAPKKDLLRHKFKETEWTLYEKLLSQYKVHDRKEIGLQTSSVGRIFDAVSSLLNLCDKQSFEGEAAMFLEEHAAGYFEKVGWAITDSYFDTNCGHDHIPTTSLMAGIISDIEKGKPTHYIAAKFHFSLVHIIDIVAANIGVNKLTFSGGVFLNSVLVDLLQYHLTGKYQLHFHKDLSPNDENISFGQMVYYDNNIDEVNKSVAYAKELQV